ncbi:MAG TPA: hypothetical protein VKU01_16015 [Bryobacteraceae bacterium]|nr:hypothetical protein [Bryobacteraceae bacterium]
MRNLFLAIPAILFGMQVSAMADTITPGTEIQVRPDAQVDVSHWDRGRIYPAHVARDIHASDGDLAIPRGSEAELIVRQVGPSQYVLDLESITVNGRRYAMDTTEQHFDTRTQNGGGVVGAIVGAIAGATGAQVETNGGEIHVPQGSVLTFRLEQPMRVVNWGDPGYSRGDYHYHHDRDWYR